MPIERAIFGPTGVALPRLGQGTWNIEQADEKKVVAALLAGIDAGMTHLDTAEMYGSGESERIVGRAIAGRRDEVFVVSKVLPSNASHAGTLRACERSLKNLGTDHLDLYLLHWRGGEPLEESFRAFEELKAAGKIRAFGVSNFDLDDLDEAVAITGEGRIACNQVLLNLEERAVEHSVVPWCERRGVAVVAYSPLGSGRFPKPGSSGGRVLGEIARAHDASPEQIALAFLLTREKVFLIPKAAREVHVRANAAAGDIVLTPAEIGAIDKAFPAQRKRHLPML